MKLSKIGFLIKDGIKSIFTHGFMSFASITIILACLVIMGSFGLLSVNIDALIEKYESENQILAFIDETLSEDEARAIEASILAVENVTDVEFISRDEAMDSFAEEITEEGYFDGITSEAFRHRYAINIEDISLMAQTASDVETVEGVAEISDHLEIARGFVTARNIVNAITLILAVILFFVSIFIMINTIKLATFGRREEIAIMKMVGATNGFIRFPFVVEGLVLGLIGSLLAFFIEWGLYTLVSERVMQGVAGTLVTVVEFSVIMPFLLSLYVGLGLVVGVFGSVIAIRNYLKV